jgi:hypothetical protein
VTSGVRGRVGLDRTDSVELRQGEQILECLLASQEEMKAILKLAMRKCENPSRKDDGHNESRPGRNGVCSGASGSP